MFRLGKTKKDDHACFISAPNESISSTGTKRRRVEAIPMQSAKMRSAGEPVALEGERKKTIGNVKGESSLSSSQKRVCKGKVRCGEQERKEGVMSGMGDR